jgi:FkbM family methyltransferase
MPALRHRAAHFLLRKLGMFDRSYREKVGGRSFVIPIINGRKTYVSEPWMSEVLERLLALKGGAFIDVGVNLGQTLLKVAAIDPDRTYVGFEPNPACVDYAWKLIQKNGLKFTVVPAGIADRTTLLHLEMFREDDTDPSASIVPAFRSNVVASRSVMVVDPEQLPEGTLPKEVAVVKIDVEGGELFVLRGLLPLLKRARPFLVVEVLPPSAPDRVERQVELERHLAELDYRLFRIRRDDREQLLTIDPIETLGIQTDLLSCDYVFAPAELAASLRN